MARAIKQTTIGLQGNQHIEAQLNNGSQALIKERAPRAGCRGDQTTNRGAFAPGANDRFRNSKKKILLHQKKN